MNKLACCDDEGNIIYNDGIYMCYSSCLKRNINTDGSFESDKYRDSYGTIDDKMESNK